MDVTQFGENTSKEIEEKFRKLGENNIKGLVLDLRGNPGGLLNEGVEVAGHFLKKNDLVVSHRGRAQPNKNYYAKSDNGGPRVSHGRGGEPLVGLRRRDRHRRAAGS